MAVWSFEPGHTAAEFCVRHMMVAWVRGCFKNIEGKLEFNPDSPMDFSVSAEIDAASLWSGDADRGDHLREVIFSMSRTIRRSCLPVTQSGSPAPTSSR